MKNYSLKNQSKLFVGVLIIFSFFMMNASLAQDKPREVSATSLSIKADKGIVKLNYFSSPSIEKKNRKITNLVIVVHGTGRNPYTYHKNMRIAADKSGASDHTLIIAPGFIMEKDLDANKDLLSDKHIFWTNNGWKQGDASLCNSEKNKRTIKMSSFEVMDHIVLQVLNSNKFPNIKQIVIAGNSAGGQFVNRYLGSNLIHEKVKKEFNIEIKYLVAAPSSYTYLSPERPVIGSPGKFYIPEADACPVGYNSYKYGLEGINEYLLITGAEKIKKQYASRAVSYFVGALDNDPNGKSLDKKCQAMLQGRERKERAELFMDYLYHLYGKRWSLNIVPGSAHNHAKMFASEEGQKWLFGSANK